MTPRDEWIADALGAADDEAAWRAQRNEDLGLGYRWPSRAEMVARWASERAEVEAQWADTEWRASGFPFNVRDDDGDAS